MQITKKLISILLTIVMVAGLLPASAFADGADQVYISVSYDGQYIDGADGSPIVYVPVSYADIAAVDLNEYGLSEYLYDENGDGTYEVTALQLVIYAHENLYGGDWSDVTFTGAAGSSYFQGGIFGFDENLNYYLNGEYPLAGEGWGATSDQIVLQPGDFLDIASFSSWDFYTDSNYGFHFFADENGAFSHAYTAEAGTALDVKLVRSYSAMGAEAAVFDAADYVISYGTSYGDATGTVTTDGSGFASVTFPSAGKWVLWADGGYGLEYPDVIVSAPAYAEVTVTGTEEPSLAAFSGATMTLGNDLSMNFYMKAELVPAGSCFAITVREKTTQVTPVLDEGGNYYVATFRGIAAKEMTDPLEIVLLDADGAAISEVRTDSPRDYAMRMLSDATIKKNLQTALVDMLNYGAAAQQFFTYKTEDPANGLLSDAQKAMATEAVSMQDLRRTAEGYLGGTLELKSNIELNFYFEEAFVGKTAAVSYTDHYGVDRSYEAVVEADGSLGKVIVDRLVVADCSVPVSVTVDGATVVDSVESYCARMQDSLTGLSDALMKFANSAWNLFHTS